MRHSSNIAALGHSDQGGRSDGVQIMVEGRHAYVGHMFSDGISVLDVADPRAPAPVGFIACPPNTRSHHLQVHDGLLLAVNSANVWALQRYASQDDYFSAPISQSFKRRERDFTAGLRVFDIRTNPVAPREVGFCPVEGLGLHRLWWSGGRYAYASVHVEGYSDFILGVFDLVDPSAPRLAAVWALPGMNVAEREQPAWKVGKRWALHHAIPAGDLLYGAWRDGGLTIHDISDPLRPRLLSHRLLSPPFAGGSHTPLPLPGRGLALLADEAISNNCASGFAHTWVFDVRDPDNPISIALFPQPDDADYCAAGGKFGPHNLHENRPGAYQSETIVFATWHNAGVRVFDLSNAFHPIEIGRCIASPPSRLLDTRPGAALVTQAADVLVDRNGVMYVTDTNGGLTTWQFAAL